MARTTENYFLTVLQSGTSKIKVLVGLVSNERSCPGLPKGCPLAGCILTRQREFGGLFLL